MGEKTYPILSKLIRFSESDDEFTCLCTFPHNDNAHLEIDRLKSLAIFGAVVQLVLKGYYDDHEGEYIYIPNDVPSYILRDVRTLTKSRVCLCWIDTASRVCDCADGLFALNPDGNCAGCKSPRMVEK